MIEIYINWIVILISSVLWGMMFVWLLEKVNGYKCSSIDLSVMLGLSLLTIYAQFFSLFYKVDILAVCIVFVVDILFAVLLRKRITEFFKEWKKRKSYRTALILTVVISIFIAILTSAEVQHYDTYLYHAQSIRWIQEYGIVPGLGNLHNRLAYNSSIFCLQALFSFRFVTGGQTLHDVNGFIVCFLLIYAISTMKAFKNKRFYISDFLKLGLIILYGNSAFLANISSCGSDHFAMGIILYILSKWVSELEEQRETYAPYVYLSLLAVFAISVKLSAAMIVILAITPAVSLVKQKKWKEIAVYISCGIVMIAPFLIRNAIISGYLLYPYSSLDLFSFDWKMPAYTLDFDRNEIKAWAWGVNDVMLSRLPVSVWMPFWFDHLGVTYQILFWANIAVMVLSIPLCITDLCKKRLDKDFVVLTVTVICSLALWFLGAPSLRYGGILMWILPLIAVGYVCSEYLNGKRKKGRKAKKDPIAFYTMLAMVVYTVMPIVIQSFSIEGGSATLEPDFRDCACTAYELEGETIFVPDGSDQAGYYAFPSTPYLQRLGLIELRGGSLAYGFRMKQEYREQYVTTYGNIMEENIFE